MRMDRKAGAVCWIKMRTCETGRECLGWITEELPVRETERHVGGRVLFLDFSCKFWMNWNARQQLRCCVRGVFDRLVHNTHPTEALLSQPHPMPLMSPRHVTDDVGFVWFAFWNVLNVNNVRASNFNAIDQMCPWHKCKNKPSSPHWRGKHFISRYWLCVWISLRVTSVYLLAK